jgi:hypothetical protein
MKKCVTRPWGEKKFCCLSRGREKKKNDWCKEQKNQKDRITYVDKSTHNTPGRVRVRRATRVRQAKLTQDKHKYKNADADTVVRTH